MGWTELVIILAALGGGIFLTWEALGVLKVTGKKERGIWLTVAVLAVLVIICWWEHELLAGVIKAVTRPNTAEIKAELPAE